MTRPIRFLMLSVALGLLSFASLDQAVADMTGTCNVYCAEGTHFTVQTTRTECCTTYLGQCITGYPSHATWTTLGSPTLTYPIQTL